MLNRKMKSEYLQQQFLNTVTGRCMTRAPPKASLSDLTTVFADIVSQPHRPQNLAVPAHHGTTFRSFQPVTVAQVQRQLSQLNTSKSAGSDTLPPAILKENAAVIAPYLRDIVNESLETGVVPDMYKLANVSAVFKSGDAELAGNYRPISLLPVMAKVLEKCVHHQLTQFIRRNAMVDAIPAEQFAFRHNHSCEDALVLAVSQWNKRLDAGELCGVVFADMSKAFDRVDHQQLINELAMIGLGSTVLTWFVNFLQGRRQRVVLPPDGQAGDMYESNQGVPQGSVLSPLLFSIYIRDIPSIFKHSISQLFADDIAFYVSGKSCKVLIHKLETDLANLDTRLAEKGLKLNPLPLPGI